VVLQHIFERTSGLHGSPEILHRWASRRVLPALLGCGLLSWGAPPAAAAQDGPSVIDHQEQSSNVSTVQRATVSGVVRNAATGEPLARAMVEIEGDANTGTLTDGEGRFELPGVPVGPQIIRVAKPGFRDRPYATEEIGMQAEGPAHSVLVAVQMPELAFALTPNCAIHGHIELSTGDPADGMTVVLLKQVIRFGRAVWAMESSTRAHGDGAYRFGSLPDGTYAVFTLPALESEPVVSVVAAGSAANIVRSGFAPMFYPDAREFAGAGRIRLSGGSQTEANFSLTLEPFYPVNIFAASQAAGAGTKKSALEGGYTALVMDGSGHMLPYTAQYDDTTHSLQANLPDGTYSVVIRGVHRNGGLIELDDGSAVGSRRAGLLAGAAEFTVNGHPIAGLRVPLGTPAAAVVHLRFQHSGDGPNNNVFATNNALELVNLNLDLAGGVPQNSFESMWSMDGGPDRISFTAQPGAYWVSTYLPRKGMCISSFTAGGANMAREPVGISLTTAPPPMDLTLSDSCGTLALALPSGLMGFVPGEEPFYTVYVVPDFDTVQDIPPMTVHPSSGPTLTVDGIAPGSYHVYTFDSPVHLEYRNPAALAALPNAGQAATVVAGSTSSMTLEVPEH